MRVAVVGASGNVGSGVLRALRDHPDTRAVVGVARRPPAPGAAPEHLGVSWRAIDVAAGEPDSREEDLTVTALTRAFDGVDAVVHLAWQIQPNHDRDLLRRTNVEGTRRVARAAVRAGVRQLVAASSWAAYSPAADDAPRDESWPTGGVRTSHYSVDKAAQERVLDDVEAMHPGLVVTRMRTALVFQAGAGAEVARYFLGPWVPRRLLRPGALPALVVPRRLRLAVVHADDAGDAYVRAVHARARGAFNVAARDLLGPDDVARLLDHGRVLAVPPGVLRPAVAAAWRARLLASDPGWLDMAVNVPVMDTARVRRELGWSERRTAAQSLVELLGGIAHGRGGPTPVLRAGDRGVRPGRLP